MRPLFLFILFFLYFTGTNAQSPKELEDSVNFYFARGLFGKAKIFAELSVEKNKMETPSQDYATALGNLASVYQALGKYPPADTLFRASLAMQKKITGEKSEDYAISLLNIGNFTMASGNYEEAEKFDLAGLKTFDELNLKTDEYVMLLNNIGLLYQNMSRFGLAKTYFLQVMDLRQKLSGENSIGYTIVLNNLGVLSFNSGNYYDAEKYLNKALEIKRKAVPQNLPDLAFTLGNLSSFYLKIGNEKAAEKLTREVLEIRKKTIGEKHIDYAVSLNNLGNILSNQKKYAEADSLYQTSLNIIKAAVSENHNYYIGALTNYAVFNSKIGKTEEAETLLKKALAICKKNSPQSVQYALVLRSLGEAYYYTGNYPAAKSYFNESLSLAKNILGENHPDYITSMIYMSDAFSASSEFQKAEPFTISALTTEKKILFDRLNFLSENELLLYIKSKVISFMLPYSILSHYNSSLLIKAAYDSHIFLNGIAIQNTASLSKQMSQSKDTMLLSLWNNYKSNKALLSKTMSQPLAKRNINLDSLSNITNKFEKQLLHQSADFRDMKDRLNIKWQDVRNNLKEKEVAIEFVKFDKTKTRINENDTSFYAAMLLRQQDTVPIFVNLFEEKQLTAALKSFAYKAPSNTRGSNPIKAATAKQLPTDNIYKLLWKPLQPYLSNIKTIYFSPDGLLHQLAFAAIPINKDSLLSDRYNLVQLASTRQLAVHEQNNPKLNSIAIFGGIDYNRQSTDTSTATTADPYAYVYQQNRGADLDSFSYLPNTLKEADIIEKDAGQATKAVLYSGANATEAAFRSLGGNTSPTIIHFATHGFTIPTNTQQNGSVATNTFKISDNPLLRCGLVMAGGNKGWEGKSGLNEDDGILTGLEISAMNLQHTQLAVLSACETGLGKLEGSEGVFGLQRAFKLAGVNYVMASLWQVPDKETAEFMQLFYKTLFGGKTIREAFLTTQHAMRKRYAPYYWAAFTLVQ